jgi:hypothetical protein
LPVEYVEWVKENTATENSSEEVKKLRKREEELLKLI